MPANPRGETVLRLAIALTCTDTFAVMLRLLSRWKCKGGFAIDDWVLVAALIPVYSMDVVAGYAVHQAGLGRHMTTLTSNESTLLLKLLILGMITYGVTISFVKISILLMYRRIFDEPMMRRATVVVGVLSIAWVFADIFAAIFLCSPISAFWDPGLLFTDHCGSIQSYLLGITISNIFLDVIILAMPLPIIWGLQLSQRRKVMLCGLFMLGGFTCIASIMRVTSIGVIEGGDSSYSFLTTYLWSHVEPATAILCACITTYRPLVISLKESLQSKFSRSEENVSKEKPWHSGSSNSNSNNGSSRSRSLPEPMRWPIGRGLRGQAELKYQNLNRKATSGKLHVIHVLPKKHDSVPHTGEYECTTIAVGREASLT